MLPFLKYGRGEPTLIMMPFLGGSQREWTEVVESLGGDYECVTLDIPGFGAASKVPGYSVESMVDAVIATISSMDLERYVLVGHSMAGKISAVAARKLRDGQSGVASPMGLVLVAPSPPGAEPMSDTKRADMLAALGNGTQLKLGGYSETDRSAAEAFVRDNIAHPISEMAFRRTVDDVLKMNPEAWVAWLEGGSEEDWSSVVGTLDLPTLVVAGTGDGALGPAAQREHTLPHFSGSRLAEVDCGHLIPLEAPAELASLILNYLESFKTGLRK